MTMKSGEEVQSVEDILQEDGQQKQQMGFLYSVTGQTPWWIVSILLHGLVITLAGLISMAIEYPNDEFATVPVTPILPPPEIKDPVKTVNYNPADVLKPVGPDATTTHENAPVAIKTLRITEEMKERAEWGDHIETPNFDMPDTHGANGNPDAQVIWTERGNDAPAGGSGAGGASLEDITLGLGSGSPGSGGNWGGGDGHGIGPGKGNGWGQYGTRGAGRRFMLVKQRGGNPNQSEPAVRNALQWLAYHQEADGHWDAKRYGSGPKTDTAVTGLALLAFLGAGHTEKVGDHAGVVRKAVAWLKSKQAADGCIWDTTDDNAGHRKIGYPCAIATMAMAEAAGMGNVQDTKAAAQKAIDYCVEIHQNGEGYDKGGWRYGPKQEADLSVSGWFIMALKSAKVSGLKVPTAAFDGAIRFLDSVSVRENQNDPYAATRYKYMAGNEHSHTQHRLTAIGTLARQFMGWKKEELQGSVEWFVNKGGYPAFGANGESVDLYYWYYGTLCVFQQQESAKELWKKWNDGMLTALVGSQCLQGDETGSWNPVGEYSGEWGRVGQTALGALCLEVYYRYELLKSFN